MGYPFAKIIFFSTIALINILEKLPDPLKRLGPKSSHELELISWDQAFVEDWTLGFDEFIALPRPES
ncbi:MAG: hypothetical protein ABIJ31_08100 [Pseudomonadota bacterium]